MRKEKRFYLIAKFNKTIENSEYIFGFILCIDQFDPNVNCDSVDGEAVEVRRSCISN